MHSLSTESFRTPVSRQSVKTSKQFAMYILLLSYRRTSGSTILFI